MDGDIGGFLIPRGEGETTLWGGGGGEPPGKGWMEWRDWEMGRALGFGVGESWNGEGV